MLLPNKFQVNLFRWTYALQMTGCNHQPGRCRLVPGIGKSAVASTSVGASSCFEQLHDYLPTQLRFNCLLFYAHIIYARLLTCVCMHTSHINGTQLYMHSRTHARTHARTTHTHTSIKPEIVRCLSGRFRL